MVWMRIVSKHVRAKLTKFQRDERHKRHVALAADLMTTCQSLREDADDLAKKHGQYALFLATK